MLVKLDENLGERGRKKFLDAGHNDATVTEQGLAGAIDATVADVCQAEGRCLVTLDLDFANPFVFSPEKSAGIAVLRLPRRSTPESLDRVVDTLLLALSRNSIDGKLWIVEPHRIREYSTPDEYP